MDRYEFLRTVLPPLQDECYVEHLATADKRINWNVSHTSIESLADSSVAHSQEGHTAYFALGSFKDNITLKDNGRTKVGRKAAQASRFKTFALDIDAGKVDETKSYPTTEEAMQALVRFIKSTKLPVPMVVLSGHGIHAYWPLTYAIAKADWRSGGLALKELCRAHRLIIDETKVHDASMVLRPLDTVNKGNAVKLILEGAGSHDPAALIPQFGRPPAPLKPNPGSPNLTSTLLAAETRQWPELSAEKITAGCAALQHITRDHGAHSGYEAWWASIGVAKFCQNPEEVAISWSSGYRSYTERETLEKLASWSTGPTRCASFSAITDACKKCVHKGVIVTPAHLGLPEPESIGTDEEVEAVPEEQVHYEPVVATDLRHVHPAIDAPPPYKRTAEGIQWLNNGVWLKICSYDLFPVQITWDGSAAQMLVEWVWKQPHVGYTRMAIRGAAIFNDSSVVDLMTALSDKGFFVETKIKQQWLSQYMRAYTQLLQQHQATTELYNSFGWKDNYSKFVLGATEFKSTSNGVVNNEVGVTKLVASKRYDEAFAMAGDLTTWTAWTQMLDHPKLRTHQLELARAFAAPLMPFTGLKGLVVSLVGRSGLGKSTMQNWAASVYGNPALVNTTAQDTQMSIVQRMGVFNCLPMAVDEVTLIKPELLANLIYWGSQGQDRNRVTETTTANVWAMILTLSTNRSLRDKTATVGADVEAIQLRLLELKYPDSEVFAKDSEWGRRVNMMLMENHGHAGRAYLEFLLRMGPARIRKEIEEHIQYVSEKYDIHFAGAERYWQIALVLFSLGSKWAKELGLIQYNYEDGLVELVRQIKQQREYLHGAKVDPYDLVAEYITVHNGMSINIIYGGSTPIVGGLIPRGEVRLRREFYVSGPKSKVDRGYAFLDAVHFHHWLTLKGYEMSELRNELTEDGVLFRPGRTGRISLGKDSPVSLPTRNALGINLNHERFKAMLNIQGLCVEPEVIEGDNVVDIAKGKK